MSYQRKRLIAQYLLPRCYPRSARKRGQTPFSFFARDLDQALAELASRYAVPLESVRALLHWQGQPFHTHAYWQQGDELRRQLRHLFFPLQQDRQALTVHRASSLVENLNSRLRNYFFLRRDIGPAYLELLPFFLNHHPYSRAAPSLNAAAKHRHNCSPVKTIRTGWRCSAFSASAALRPKHSGSFVVIPHQSRPRD
jgi:hypothetical protein